MRLSSWLIVPILFSFVFAIGQISFLHGQDGKVEICKLLHAKKMPDGFSVDAMKFTGPAGDGRRGSAGFVVKANDLVKGSGTQLSFDFQRAASGFYFQIIHPFENGHVLISLHRGVSIHRGGTWGDIGWGNPATSDKIKLSEKADEVLPIKPDTLYKVVSRLSANGEYDLTINETSICRHKIEKAVPLELRIDKEKSFWLGSGWNKATFVGKNFESKLEKGHAGLVLGPMDGSGPTHFFKNVFLSATSTDKAAGNSGAAIANAKNWRDELTGPVASKLAEKHPVFSELQSLKSWLTPPKGTSKEDLQKVFGKASKVFKAERKTPYVRHVYPIGKRASLNVILKEGKVESAWFAHYDHKVRPTPLNIGAGTKLPTYSYRDYLHDLRLSADNLGNLLVEIQKKGAEIPWAKAPIQGPG